MFLRPASRVAKCLARERRAVGEGFELRPGDLRMAAQPEAAIRRSNDVFSSHDLREPLDPLRHELGMLDQRRRVRHDAGRQNLRFRQIDFSQSVYSCSWRALAASNR